MRNLHRIKKTNRIKVPWKISVPDIAFEATAAEVLSPVSTIYFMQSKAIFSIRTNKNCTKTKLVRKLFYMPVRKL